MENSPCRAHHSSITLSWKWHPWNQLPESPPDLIKGEHEYKVEAIIANKRQGRGHVYLIKWKGYPTGDNSWEPEWNLTHATAILTKYKRRHHITWRRKTNSHPLSTPNYSTMENTNQPLSSSLTLLSPSPDDKENHPPLFTDFHIRDIIHYFNTKFETFDQYLLYLQWHLSDWQPDPHFQHFHTAYVHYQTMNDHIDSIGKTLKTMEKTRDNLKGTINCLTPVLHKKGLQSKIQSITNHTRSSSVSFADPISESISDDSTLSYTSTSPEPLPVPPPQRCNEQEFCQTWKYPLKYNHILWAMGQDNYDGCTCRCPKPEKDTPQYRTNRSSRNTGTQTHISSQPLHSPLQEM